MKLEDKAKVAVHKRSQFDLSYDGVLSMSWGDIVPIVCKEMVPGDSFTCDAQAFVRMAPLATPTYGRIHGYINYFFVPNRILMADEGWQNFIRGGVSGTADYELPTFTMTRIGQLLEALDNDTDEDKDAIRRIRKLFTYFGLPDPLVDMGDDETTNEYPFELSVLPFAAYNRIYGDYYYPWGLENDVYAEQAYFAKMPFGNVDDGAPFTNSDDYFCTKKACYKKDYFTTAQVSPQRGGQAFAVTTNGSTLGSGVNGFVVDGDNDVTQNGASSKNISAVAIRWATQFQKFLERNNIAGSRYFEQILARFGVKIKAEELQRSQYLGGQDFWINVSDVTSTSATSDASLGDMAGKGIGLGRSGVSYRSDDYGFFIALLHVMPESGIVQGVPRMFLRNNRFMYYQPELEETGMQPIYNVEVWGEHYLRNPESTASVIEDTGVYGYIPRDADYKYSAPLLAGDFRLRFSDPTFTEELTDMDSMHLYRMFYSNDGVGGDIPVLNSNNVRLTYAAENGFNRIFQDTNTDFDHFWVNIQVKLGAIRPMLGYVEASTDFTGDENNGSVSLPSFGMRL